MTTVVKRGGRRQSFMPSKVRKSIAGAARKAGLSRKKVEDTVKNVGNGVIDFAKKKRTIKTTDIRKSILGRLGRVSKATAAAWKSSEKKKQRAEKKKAKKAARKRTKKKTGKKRTRRKKRR